MDGVWVGGGPVQDLEAQGGLKPGELDALMLPWAKALMATRDETQEPHNACLPMGVPRVTPFPYRFVQNYTHKPATHMFILHEGNIHTYRQIFMDGRKHPAELDSSWLGHSIGHWEKDTLVIDTVGYNDKFWFDRRGHPHTEQLHTIERWTRLNLGQMENKFTLDDPGAFGVEHNDALVVRDLGWLLIWVDTAQEMLDTTLLAYRIAEDRRVFLPIAISADGAFLTHSQTIVQVPTKAKVDRFLPKYDRGDLQLHPDNPITVAPQANEDWVIEIRRQNNEAMNRAYTVIEEAYADFRKEFGRGPENPWFEEYMTEDADVILMGMGTISLPFKVGIRNMRAQGKKVGLIRPRWFRPFPTEKMVAALSGAKAIGVIDRDYSFGSPFGSGVVANEIRAAMYNSDKRPPLLSFICGLGGREVTLEDVYKATDLCYEAAKTGKSPLKTQWLGVRE